jgi:TonB family protein
MRLKVKPGRVAGLLAGWLLCLSMAKAQAPMADGANNPQMLLAESLVGKALFLRGFYLNNDLSFDAAGHLTGVPKVGDWTVAAVNVQRVQRKGPVEIELDGVRAVIRYNPDAHEFQRHPLNDEKIKILVADSGNLRGFETAIAAIFAVGIDPGLQRAMPEFWRHYFDPNLAWPQDSLSGQTIYALYGQADQPKDVTPPKVEHRTDAGFTNFAERDRVQGGLLLRMVVDAQGVPHRISVARPLGYGLDERAVDAVTKWRFTPGMRDGKPVATGVVVQIDFAVVAPPRR